MQQSDTSVYQLPSIPTRSKNAGSYRDAQQPPPTGNSTRPSGGSVSQREPPQNQGGNQQSGGMPPKHSYTQRDLPSQGSKQSFNNQQTPISQPQVQTGRSSFSQFGPTVALMHDNFNKEHGAKDIGSKDKTPEPPKEAAGGGGEGAEPQSEMEEEPPAESEV